MSEGALIFTGEIDFRTGSKASITTPKSFATRSDVGGAKTVLITNGDNHLKRVVCVTASTSSVSLEKKSGFTEDRHKKFTHHEPGGGGSGYVPVKFEFLLPRYQSIIIEKDSTDKIYIQKSVLSGEGVSTDTDGTNVVVTPIDRTYENARGRIKPLGKAVSAAGVANKTNLNNATCFVASSSTTDDTSSGRHLVITNSAGVIQSQIGIPGYTYMKIRKNRTDMVYIEEALQLNGAPTVNDQSIAAEAFVNVKLTPCAILD